MGCVPAPACKALLAQATALWPKRNKASDGICGDARHQARKSDHNLGNAVDLTHDPKNGCDAHAIAELVKASDDPRVSYIISNQRIWNPKVSPKWRAYSGSNPHIKHVHISIKADKRGDTSPWPLTSQQEDDDVTPEEHDWLGRIHHEVAGGDTKAATLTQMLEDIQRRLAAIEQAHGIED